MKKLLIRVMALFAISLFTSFGVQAAIYDAGSFSEHGDAFETPQPTGNFLDQYSFSVSNPNGLDIIFSGTHEGMFQDDLLLTNIGTDTQYHLGVSFSETLNLGQGDYVFTLSGFALNAIDHKINSNYDLSIKAVPLPAAAWLFGSALLGFVSFSRRRKV
ncbi:MAG: VPLPA-CTERM sorting domain-containing protein [Candidatus Thiodiazotropha sp. (ex Dulcina madagascariensis)]|nr:VPLPA-CTERM sorting domain-containing protein [Candidatus Thiodiazotropha sp. (ex Dulcina madagascariensis)]MCU7927655.1 VPLPA-CTERM sorting domain-containing protein [Candidatus Thiodiazotropha sp. (ex Dulcina madagascariensis)]MCU7935543.1 VPLPA-CTERM sorting domain-containing protein [Candidatus Thiodiazotropha sp. (ex Dulcina madagascariensis)]